MSWQPFQALPVGPIFACRCWNVIGQAQNRLEKFQVLVENRMTRRLSSDILARRSNQKLGKSE
jgi:hypothetical protein